MALKVLGNWEYTPKFADNKKMSVVFKRLSGAEEMKIIGTVSAEDRSVALFMASIEELKEPLKLEMPDGEQRSMTIEDISTVPELKDLFYELLTVYSKRSDMTGDDLKKPE